MLWIIILWGKMSSFQHPFKRFPPSKKCSKNVLIRGENAMIFSDFQYLSKGGDLGWIEFKKWYPRQDLNLRPTVVLVDLLAVRILSLLPAMAGRWGYYNCYILPVISRAWVPAILRDRRWLKPLFPENTRFMSNRLFILSMGFFVALQDCGYRIRIR